jgi:Mg2+/citrate symporter
MRGVRLLMNHVSYCCYLGDNLHVVEPLIPAFYLLVSTTLKCLYSHFLKVVSYLLWITAVRTVLDLSTPTIPMTIRE